MDLSHTLEVKPNLFIRSYLRFYDAEPNDINTCKLFWGGIGMVVLPILLLALSPILAVVAGMIVGYERIKRTAATRPVKTVRRNSRREETLEAFSQKMAAVWFKVATPVSWFFRIAVGLVVLGALAWAVKLLIDAVPTWSWDKILLGAGLTLMAVAVGILGGLGVMYLYTLWRNRHPRKPKKPSVFKAVIYSVHDHTCANVKITREA